MDGITISTILDIGKAFGLPGIILIMWWIDQRGTQKILMKYREDMQEQRRMYENTVKLCESYMKIADGLQDVVMMNTQSMIRMADKIETNQFCPMVRGKRQTAVPEG